MRAPELDVPVVEIESLDGEIVDLYNEFDLVSATLSGDVLSFHFVEVIKKTPICVEFQGVRMLSVIQGNDWVTEEGLQIEHLLVRSSGPYQRFMFKAGGFEYEFNCSAMRLVQHGHE